MKKSTPNYKDYLHPHGAHQQELRTPQMKVPSRLFVSDDLLPSNETLAQIESIAANDGLFRHTAAMSDVCSKPGRKNASGTTIVSEHHILPQVNDSDPNCGMRLVRTNLHEDTFSADDIDRLFQSLVSVVPTKTYVGTTVSFDTVVDICRKGTQAAIDALGMKTRNEIENSMSAGNFFGKEMSRREIFDAIPRLFLFMARHRLGIIGAAGNHFVDLMKVTDIVDADRARKLNLAKGQYLFMVHTGSGILGQYTMYMYTAKRREHMSQSLMVALGRATFDSQLKKIYESMARKIEKHMTKESLLSYDADSMEGKLYMTARDAASNFGTANRATIIHNISETIKTVFDRDPAMDLLYDLPHIYIGKENHFGKNVWVHRNNTSRAYGPSRMAHHPLFGQTGEPVFIPSSMSTAAYIGVGTDNNEDTFFSAPHGTGKAARHSEDDVPQNRTELFEKMARKGVKLYNARSSKVMNQDSSRYKNIERVINGVVDNKIATIVAKMEPVAVIMY